MPASAPEKKHAVKTITCNRTGFPNGSAAPIVTLPIALSDANVGDPVALSARKTRFDIFAFEVRGGAVKPRFLNVLQCVDIDNRVETIRDFAGHQRHGAAARANVERCRSGTKRVLRHERAIANDDRQPGFRMGCPDAAVLDAERTAACPRRNFGWAFIPIEFEGDIAAVAFAVDQHANRPLTRLLDVGVGIAGSAPCLTNGLRLNCGRRSSARSWRASAGTASCDETMPTPRRKPLLFRAPRQPEQEQAWRSRRRPNHRTHARALPSAMRRSPMLDRGCATSWPSGLRPCAGVALRDRAPVPADTAARQDRSDRSSPTSPPARMPPPRCPRAARRQGAPSSSRTLAH